MELKKILLLFIFIFSILHFAGAQISPGELSKAHAFLEGSSNCVKCHAIGGSRSTKANCLGCHKEIQANISSKNGYHASVAVRDKDCAVCHNEHHGREFRITRFEKKTFDHNKSGFPLKGKHATKECAACHKPAFIKDPNLKKRANSFLGLKSECLNCHADYHQGKLSPNCANCHTFDSFKKATGFDHSHTHFPLLGKHNGLECTKCHKSELVNGKPSQSFSGLTFNNCTACHKDIHNNRFGQNCKQCHSEESFMINKGMKAFDHEKTNFKLIGKHKLVECKACHKTSLTTPIKHGQCQDCHADFHKKEFTVNGVTPDCDQCHNVTSFSPSTFNNEKHKLTQFPLEESHLATSCLACHKKQNVFKFKNMGTRCVDCHNNEHSGFIEKKFFPKENCLICHSIKNWKASGFNHAKKGFDMDGAHEKLACAACHYAKDESGVRTQIFAGLSHDCASCHKDIHVGQFQVKGKVDCSLCHITSDWKKANFDHNSSRFKLEGGHKGLACNECHKVVSDKKGKYIQYKFEDITCIACHE
jgi:hypothetical protein